RPVAEKCVLFLARQAAAPVLSRHFRPDVASQKIQELGLAVSANHATRKARLAFLKRTTNRLGLAFARQFRDLGCQSLDVRVLNVERHRYQSGWAWCNLSTWVYVSTGLPAFARIPPLQDREFLPSSSTE